MKLEIKSFEFHEEKYFPTYWDYYLNQFLGYKASFYEPNTVYITIDNLTFDLHIFYGGW